MRRAASLIAALCVSLAVAAPAAAFNPQIAGLQIALRERGLYRGSIDGVQGSKTRRAVRIFQGRHGLVVDGLAGPRTRGALGRLGRPLFGTRPLRRGAVGYDVGVLQFLLARHGARPGRLDARFGGATERALRRFQRRAGLAPDGIVGRRTARRLCALPSCKWRAVRRGPRRRLHRVRAGETLTAISRRYGVGLQRLARANRFDPSGILLAGARLRIPLAARAALAEPFAVRAALDYWAGRYGVDPRLVRAVAWLESGFNNTLVSSAGARGIMQVTPPTWAYVETVLLRRQIPHTPGGNIRVGVAYLRQLLREFRGNVRLALAAYAQGLQSVRTRGVLRETRRYVADVLALREQM